MITTVSNKILKSWQNNGRLKFVCVALGIFFSYFIVGILQEEIMRGCYGEKSKECKNGEKFTYAVTIALVQNLFAFIIIKTLDCIKPENKDATPTGYYIGAGVVCSLAMVTTTMALRWVTFPMQVIFKSAKPIAVMIINLFMCKRYTIQRYFFVLLIVIGVVLFKLFEYKEPKAEKPEKKVDKKEADDNELFQWLGIGVLVFSLCMDGTLGAIEDRIKRIYSPTSRQMMISICGWSAAALIIAVAATSEIIDVIKFACRYPEVVWQLFVLGMAGALGQLFIFTMVASFGALSCSVTTTVRKFISVVFSIIFFGNPSTGLQWIGTVLVFSALLADAAFGKKSLFSKNENKTGHEKSKEGTSHGKPSTTKANGLQPNGHNIV